MPDILVSEAKVAIEAVDAKRLFGLRAKEETYEPSGPSSKRGNMIAGRCMWLGTGKEM